MGQESREDGRGDAPWAGFASEEQRAAAQALVEQCAQFKGFGDALKGRHARASEAASQITFEEGWVTLPALALRDLPAGAAGRLGLALMGAARELSSAAPPSPPAKPSGNSAWLDEAPASSSPAFNSSSFPEPRPKAPRKFAEEGEGEESFGYLVNKLEEEGFGGASHAVIAANLAKAAARKKKRSP